MRTIANNTLNGVNVTQLVGTIDAIKGNADIAKFKFRSKTQWVTGGNCKTEIQSFYGATQEDTTRTTPFILEGDEPAILLGTNKGPNAVEAVLHALGSCLSVGIVYNAAARGIEVSSLSFSLEGDLDLHCFLGLSKEKRAGYEDITINIQVETNATPSEFRLLMDHVLETSPVLDIIKNPVPVTVNY